MEIILFLILFPFLAALVMSCMKQHGLLRRTVQFTFCGVIVAAVILFAVMNLVGGKTVAYLPHTHVIDMGMLLVEWGLVVLVFYYSFKYRKYYCALLSILQTGAMTWLELSGRTDIEANHILADKLTVAMALIVGIVGCLICIYAIGYMKDYNRHHLDYKDRRSFFFAMLFLFLGAMMGLIFSSNLIWIYFFWEITSICSFLLIGYNQTDEAMDNSFRALWMNLLGGLGFAVAIIYSVTQLNIINIQDLVNFAVSGDERAGLALIPVVFLAFAGLTKSAQLPFSGWLLGAMVAPTPTSALLHSATMVKAGVYLLIRLAPALQGNTAGLLVTTIGGVFLPLASPPSPTWTTIGGFTFLMTSMLAISQDDGKKVLAYSTISNLGLITACAGVGMHEAVWAGILLMMFHAVSKSLMFLSVGAVENCTGSRNVEDMHGLIVKLPGLAYVMIIGIAGMFLAPFGMLISKWAALKAYVDSGSILLVIFLVFGSATTLFYWTKWLGTLVAVHHHSERVKNVTKKSEWTALLTLSILMILLCLTFPVVSSGLIEPFLMDMYHTYVPNLIGTGNLYIMIMMLCLILVLPVAVRLLTFGKKNKIVMSYMGGANAGDDRNFTDSFGEEKRMYLANWYLADYFGENKILVPSLVFAAGALIILLILTIGGAVV